MDDLARSLPECSPSWPSCWWWKVWRSWVWRCRHLKAGYSLSCYRHWRCTWNTQHTQTHIKKKKHPTCKKTVVKQKSDVFGKTCFTKHRHLQVRLCVFLSQRLTSRNSASVWWSVWSPGCWGCSRGRCRGQRSLVGTVTHGHTSTQFTANTNVLCHAYKA